jgi:Sensors of blue-light using FAD
MAKATDRLATTSAPAGSPAVLQRLMYCSVSAGVLGQNSLAKIFDIAQRNNLRDGITSVLLVDGRLLIQFIEGPELAVQALWSRIAADPQHHCIVQLLLQNGATRRLFGPWPMLHGQATRAEILALVRTAYISSPTSQRPAWAHSIGPLMVLLDGEFSHTFTNDSP